MATINVKDAAGSTVALEKPLAPGAALAAASRPVTLATDDALVTATGATTDAVVAAGAAGSIAAKLRRLTTDIGSLVTAIGSTAWDLGSGTGGSRTQRVILDSTQFQTLGTAAKASATAVSLATDQPVIAVADDTSKIGNGDAGTLLTPKFAAVSVSSSGDNTVVAAVTSKKIRVIAWDVKVNAAVNFKWKSATAGDKTGLYYCSSQGDGVARSYNPVGYFETASGEALVINLSGAVAVGGVLTYVEV